MWCALDRVPGALRELGDGRPVCDLDAGCSVMCTPATATARFVRFGAHHYHQVLKAKFGLTDR